jgi:hypothetical protein
MTEYLGSQVSLQDLERRIAEHEARLGERERITLELNALAAFVRVASDELTRATEKLSGEVTERATWIRALASVAQRPATNSHASGSSVWDVHLGAVSRTTTACSDTLQRWAQAEAKVAKALVRLRELKQRQSELSDGTESALFALRQRRDELRGRLEARVREASPVAPGHDIRRSMTVKRKDGKVEEHDRFDWSDLPEYHGASLPGGAVTGRGCLNCGAPLPHGRKRFCSKGCYQGYLELFGSAAFPKSVGGD